MTQSPGGAPPLLVAFRLVGLQTREVWVRYVALGGTADEVSVAAQIHGFLDLPPGEYNVLAHALDEELEDIVAACGSAVVPLKQTAAREEPGRRDR
ncbi:hypothetical protein [Geodermatophilus sp. URMC 62]|uniref:hypothetical protein n=1 Tax=Geodermatophilus sp. URMC 62 TaxID=3423414 RepID=UPI00406CD524